MSLPPGFEEPEDVDERAARAVDMVARVEHQGAELYSVTRRDETYHVDLADGTCECPDHRHRDAECKHLRRVALEVSAGRTPPPSSPRITQHREHPRQGGARYYRCGRCGYESVHERLRRRGCPNCTGRTTAPAAEPAPRARADGGDTSHTEETHE